VDPYIEREQVVSKTDNGGSQSAAVDIRKLVLGAVFSQIENCTHEKDIIELALAEGLSSLGGMSLRWYRQQFRQWKMVGGVGLGGTTPLTPLLDSHSSPILLENGYWELFSIPFLPQETPQFLVAAWNQTPTLNQLEAGRIIAEAVHSAIQLFRTRERLKQRADLLSILFAEASAWHLHQDTPRMLEKFARVLTTALRADRASLFLWDRPAKQLIGYPALGVEGGELRIPDKAGIVGAVLQSQQAKRWDSGDPESEVNRRIDQQTGYHTQSLAAVPLTDSRGHALGVLELINHQSGTFSLADENVLLELAKPISMILEGIKTIEGLTKTRDYWVSAEQERIRIIGQCSAMEAVRQMTSRVAATDLAVMILGENGTGKEVIAKTVHLQSERRTQPFVAVNCAAIAESLLESELFGHEKGAFTDAIASRAGKFELATGGTLFLDEIGDMSLNGQSKLLRVLEEKVVVRVGGSTPISTDVRVIAATNQNLVELVAKKQFREDLFFRLNVVTLRLPPLRERGEDVLELADFFLDGFCTKIRRSRPRWSESAKQKMLQYHWPGNVRELRNMMERLAYLQVGEEIQAIDLDFSLQRPDHSLQPHRLGPGTVSALDIDKSLAEVTDDFQMQVIQAHIEAANGNISAAAQSLGLHRSNLYRKMRQLGMQVED
jgi:transcriptional regulator with GAF, ATPase, and Fis domain